MKSFSPGNLSIGLALGSEYKVVAWLLTEDFDKIIAAQKLQKQESNTRGLCATGGGAINSNNCHMRPDIDWINACWNPKQILCVTMHW